MDTRKFGILGAFALFVLGSTASWGAISTIGFDLSGGSSFQAGQVFTLNLEATNWTQPLDGGGVDLSFNAGVLQLQSVTVNESVFDFAPQSGAINNTLGSVTDVTFNAFFNPSPTGKFDIASFQFVAQGAGSSGLNLSTSALNPFSSGGVQLNAGSDFNFATASVSVQSIVPGVPEPPTGLLLAAAAGIALFISRRRGLNTN